MNKFDWLLLSGVIVVILVGVFVIVFYFNYINSECSVNPLVYGAKQLEKNIDAEVYGKIMFFHSEGKIVPQMFFNSTKSWFDN